MDSLLLHLAHENFYETWRIQARTTSRGAIEERAGLLLAATGAPVSGLNKAIITRLPPDPAVTVARARAFFAERALPWELYAHGDAADAIAPAAAAAGLTPGDPEPGMLLSPLAGAPRTVPGLTIRGVDSPADLRLFNDVAAQGIGIPRELVAVFDAPKILAELDVALYLGYVDDQPVATSQRVTSHRIAGIQTVSTLPAYRNRGIGEAITWRAALDGLAEGCIAASLQASTMGFPIYARMGFRHVIDYQTWTGSPDA